MKNQDLAHSYAYAGKDESRSGSNFFYGNDKIYSFGYHFIIAKKIRNKIGGVDFVLFNAGSYSNTTSCQQNLVENALYQKVVKVTTDISNFNAINEIKAKETLMFGIASTYSRARRNSSKTLYLNQILDHIEDIKFLADYYRVKSKVPNRIKAYYDLEAEELLRNLGVSADKRATAKKNADIRAEKKQALENTKKAKQEKENILKWKSHEQETISLRWIKEDFLRISTDGLNIETTQGINVEVKEAKRLLKLIDNKKIIGAKINDNFTVTAFNGFLKVGCHNVSIEEINSIRAKITVVC